MAEPSSEFQVELPIEIRIDNIVASLPNPANPLTTQFFDDPDLFQALPADIRESDQELAAYIANTGNFQAILRQERRKRDSGDTSGLLGEDVILPETEISEVRRRRQENGHRINVEYLRSLGIDPTKVLFFRFTQPSDSPKPEPYWTSDYFETTRGLNVEIPSHLRKSAITLVSDLQTINENGGLIQDVNDDNGLPVRQIGNAPFDQSRAFAKIIHSSSKIVLTAIL